MNSVSEISPGSPFSEGTFQGLFEAAPDAIVILDAEGTIVLVSTETERLFGYSRTELLGKGIQTLIPERVGSPHLMHGEGYFADARPRVLGSAFDLYGRHKDGSQFPVEISLRHLETKEGVLVSAAIRDITERMKADEQRFRLAAIVNSSDDAIIGKTLDGVITTWNDGARRIFGYTAEEVIGKPGSILVPPGHNDEEQDILWRIGRGERVQHFDAIRLRKDGSEIHVSITSSPVRDSDGKLIGASKVARDITARIRSEHALAAAKDEALAANRELEAFSYSVAHDLRAPLRGMNGFAQVLLDTYGDKLDADGQDWLQEILLNARKMGALIDALLSLGRLTRTDTKHERVNLSALARADAARLAAAEPGRAVEFVIADGLEADLDPELARALIDNLFGNAWKFTGKVASARIELGVTEKDGVRAFFVRDNGAGFDMAFAGKLFGAFQRLHSADEFPGTGIGLATVQRIARRHGGRIWAEGAVDAGATFYFTFADAPPGNAP
jgi:PAS domain S-box-containing protein